jgi:hypothetical protein
MEAGCCVAKKNKKIKNNKRENCEMNVKAWKVSCGCAEQCKEK